MKLNIKSLVISIAIPLLLGAFVGLLTAGTMNYNELILPSFAPPAIVFPIVWTILYILMGISAYLIYEKKAYYQKKALFIYKVQLIVNLLWSIIFFLLDLKVLAFIWILLLIVLVIFMIKEFYQISKPAAYLQIPYLLWIIFAAILNLSIIFLN